MAITLTDIELIDGHAEMTDQEVADALNVIHVTVRPIPLGDLLFVANNRGMLSRLIRPTDTGEKWGGTLVNLILFANENLPQQAPLLNQFFSHITNDRNNVFDSSVVEFGAPFYAIVSGFGGQPNMPSIEDFAALVALGGGWKYGDVTSQQVAAIRAEVAEAEAFEALRQQRENWQARFDAAMNKIGTENQAAGVAAVRAIADEMEGA